MKRTPFRLSWWLALIAILLFALPAAATPPDFVSLSQALKPAVVNINTSKTTQPRLPVMPGPGGPRDDFFNDFFNRFFQGHPNRPQKQRSLGSGFIISEDGYILTNDHVVSGADEIKVQLSDGRTFSATIKGLDPKIDLALLKIDTGADLPVVTLGSSDSLRVGEWVMAIGNPFGLEQTVTAGIVSAKGRVIGAGPYDDFIQTDASINPGNSGGPLFNASGEVVGINTAIVAGGQGIGFAIPIDLAKGIIPQLKEKGHVTRGWLGVSVQAVSEELAASFGLEKAQGALVTSVTKNSPADKAGMARGDIILSFDGQRVDNISDLPRLVASTPVNKSVPVKIFRDGKAKKLAVVVGLLEEEGAEQVAQGGESAQLGLSVADLTADNARRYGLEQTEGVLITAVAPEGPAAEANLRAGDLILEANGTSTPRVGVFKQIVAKTKKDEVIRLLVQRGEGFFYAPLKVR
ncbi:DegQ family serine endoprotease [Desulfuromonas sp. AOP6]|uniref:DegQ family serine endoprotease n=1 Tax=Desulfuromonas sp. AOP6 TaxID=1566351 RepID=UPI0012DC5FEB|nr:DegQ family serine endoprotease [Desulfuromonas sp. AOP6]